MSESRQILIDVRGVCKKFCSDIKFNMLSGIKDTFFSWMSPRSYMKLRKHEFWALRDINFTVRSGDIVGILGTNGSGKTTLMRLIANIYETNVGSIQMPEGLTITPIFALKSGMSPVFTGMENIYIKGSMLGMTKQEIDDSMNDILEFSEIRDFINMPFGNYSSGMGARLAYAIAVATDPNVFIIDEALAVGDDHFKEKCFDHLRSFAAREGKCVLFVSNNIDKVRKIATRVIILDKGRLALDTHDIEKGFDYYLNRGFESLDDIEKQRILLDNQNSDTT